MNTRTPKAIDETLADAFPDHFVTSKWGYRGGSPLWVDVVLESKGNGVSLATVYSANMAFDPAFDIVQDLKNSLKKADTQTP